MFVLFKLGELLILFTPKFFEISTRVPDGSAHVRALFIALLVGFETFLPCADSLVEVLLRVLTLDADLAFTLIACFLREALDLRPCLALGGTVERRC